jgi:hypothetical protein
LPSAADDRGRHPEHDRERRRSGGLADRVPRGHVSDLVADHAGQLVLAARQGQQAARHEDRPAGQCEGVRLLEIDHVKAVGHVLARRVSREA